LPAQRSNSAVPPSPISSLLALVLCTLLTQPAAAQMKRGCSGAIRMSSAPTGSIVLANMDASGFCKNRRHANDCRKAARRAIDNCAGALWDARWSHAIPAACTTRPGGGRAGMNYFRWTQIIVSLPHGDSLKDRIEHNVCCGGGGRSDTYQARICWYTNGDTGCVPSSGGFSSSGGGTFSSSYGVKCAELRAAGLCGTARRTNP